MHAGSSLNYGFLMTLAASKPHSENDALSLRRIVEIQWLQCANGSEDLLNTECAYVSSQGRLGWNHTATLFVTTQ